MGLASFVISILTIALVVALFIVSYALVASEVGNLQDPQSLDPQTLQDSPILVWLSLIGLGFVVCAGLFLLGLALGVAGIFQRRRKRLFAILGTVFNGTVLLLVVALLVVGLAVSGVQGTT